MQTVRMEARTLQAENTMTPGQMVESYKFGEIVALWARERVEHELVVARALARGVIVDGLRLQSVDPRWLKQDRSLNGYPYVGYVAVPDGTPILLRAEVLEHLLSVVRSGAEPDVALLNVEFITRSDFLQWLLATSQALPRFWFSADEPLPKP
jgi:hypothetical protein